MKQAFKIERMMTGALPETRLARPALRNFGAALAIGWIVLGSAAWVLAGVRHVPPAIALPIALGYLTELPFYLLLGFGEVRDYLEARFTRVQLAGAIWLSAVLPSLLYFAASGTARLGPSVALIGMMAAVSLWFLPRVSRAGWAGVRDVGFLILVAAIIISGVLARMMPEPVRHVPMEVLGHISLVRGAMLAVVLLRGADETGIGFIPRLRDLGVGLLWAAAAGAVAFPIGLRLGQLRISGRAPGLWQSIGLLLGVFWVLALSEEFFFRGLLQRWISQWTRSTSAGLGIASLLFGACHLGWSRSVFPNWRYAILATILGLGCGAAFLHARSIRASMVTHAFLVSAWRLFFS